MMERVLVIAVLGVAASFLLVTLVILLEKASREIRDGSRRARRRLLEPLVLHYAHGADASIVATAGVSLGAADRVVVEMILLDHVARVRGIEHERICRALDELGFVDRFLADLHSPSWWKRAEAAEKLGLAGAKRAAPRLTVALEDDVAVVRLRAAKALGLVGGRAAGLPLIQALSEPNRWSTIRIADILAAMGRDVVSELMEAFPTQNMYAKLAALDILGRIHALSAVPWLVALLADRERDVRARAAHALGAIGAGEAAPQLRSALTDREWPVRAMAAKALGLVRDVAAIPALCAALRDREWWVRANAAAALKVMGPKGVEALEGMLQDADTFAQQQACLALEDAGILDRRVAQLGTFGIVGSAAESIVTRFVRAGRVGRLHELATSHAEPAVREVLGRILPREIAPGAAR